MCLKTNQDLGGPMKLSIFAPIFVILSTHTAWASPLLLKCRINQASTVINVESMIANGCKTEVFNKNQDLLQTRYTVTLCDAQQAEGVVEVMNSQNQWIEVADFSTQKNCYLFRNIETDYNCKPGRQRNSDCN